MKTACQRGRERRSVVGENGRRKKKAHFSERLDHGFVGGSSGGGVFVNVGKEPEEIDQWQSREGKGVR